MNYSSLTLHFHDDLTINGEVTYKLDANYLFLLDPRFVITEIRDCDGNKLKYAEKNIEGKPILGSKKLIQIPDTLTNVITIEYRSKKKYKNPPTLSRWVNRYNHYEKDRISLDDGYIAFYPLLMYADMTRVRFERPLCCAEPAKIYGLENFYLVNSSVADDCMLCHTSCPQINKYKILAFRKETYFQYTSGVITTITPSKKEKENAKDFAEKSNLIVKWYNEHLYTKDQLKTQIIFISHDKTKNYNGFWRNDIIEYDRFLPAGTPAVKTFIPHELGHNWCNCTGKFTFTDRLLEEGGAEWSAGIYRFTNDKEEFEQRRIAYINETERYIKRADRFMKKKKIIKKNSQYLLDPHHTGFYFFNLIYEKYGIDKVKDCILYFALEKQQRNIETFLKNARKSESDEVYYFLKEQLDFLLPYCM